MWIKIKKYCMVSYNVLCLYNTEEYDIVQRKKCSL